MSLSEETVRQAGTGTQPGRAAGGAYWSDLHDREHLAAARGELEALRDRAARALGFELAGRIQDEIQALDWVTGPQRVTTIDPDDAEVHGWAGGVLVRFVITGGSPAEPASRWPGPR
jgi:excinuclease ABC subunit C